MRVLRESNPFHDELCPNVECLRSVGLLQAYSTMPRTNLVPSGWVNLVALRLYVSGPERSSGEDILTDALVHQRTGAVELVRLVLGIRWNARTRRTLEDVRREFSRASSRRAHWLQRLGTSLITHWRVLRRDARPLARDRPSSTGPLALAPRRVQRLLRPAGLTGPPLRTLAERAAVAARAVWDFVDHHQCVLWLDNWCMLRWGTDPTNPEYTQNVTALAVLNLDTLLERPVATRGTTIPPFPGHPDLGYLLGHAQGAAALCTTGAARLHGRVAAINQTNLGVTDVRVPLDVQRTGMRSLRWHPLSLTEQTVSANVDLLELLETARQVQRRTTRQLPLLVDENIHYRVLRLLYATPFQDYDVRRYLADLPLVYGIWHAYKHTLLVVYRAYLPVLVHLEGLRGIQANSTGRSHRKVLYLEKLFAALLLCRPHVGDQLRARVEALRRSTSTRICAYSVQLLFGLHDLVFFYVPALLQLGFKVRECAWNGRPEGQVRGDTARGVLEHALLIQVHLLQDWSARTEYVKTISCALACWQPWYSRLPGCVFVEEACEAMLSRLAALCRHHPTNTTFEGTLRLFLTMPLPSDEPRDSRGSVRGELVHEMTRRVRALVGNPDGRLFPLPRDSGTFTWTDCVNTTWVAAGPVPRRPSSEDYAGVIRCALRTMVGSRAMGTDLLDWMRTHIPRASAEDVENREVTLVRLLRVQPRVRPPTIYAHMRVQGEDDPGAQLPSSSSAVTTGQAGDGAADDAGSMYDGAESLYEPPEDSSSDSYVSPAFTDWVSEDDSLRRSPSVATTDESSG